MFYSSNLYKNHYDSGHVNVCYMKLPKTMKHTDKHTDDQLREWYVNKGLSSIKIAKIVNVWPQTVRGWLKMANIPIRSRNIIRPSKEQLEKWYITEGKSSRKIAEIVGVGKSTILQWLKQAGIPSRNHREATLRSYNKKMPSDEQLYEWYIKEKKSMEHIAKITNLSQSTISKYLRKLDIKFRSPRETAFLQYKKEVEKPTNKQLYDWYVVQRKTPKDIGEIIGVSSSTIRTWLNNAEISLRVGSRALGYTFEKPTGEELKQMYVKERKSSSEIAEIIGVSSTTVVRWLKKKNIPIRTMSEAVFVRHGKNIKKPSKEQLEKWYIEEMKTTIEIGDLVGVTFTTVREWLSKYKIQKRKSKYGMKYYVNCRDGHKVKSSYERTVDNWLFDKGIPHDYNGLLSESKEYRYDFKVDRWFIEIWGLKDVDFYDKKMDSKIHYYDIHKFKRIDIFPDDIARGSFIEKLNPLLAFSNPDRKIYIPPRVSKEKLHQWYILEEKSSYEIAEIVGVSRPLILKWLKQDGIPVRSNKEAALLHAKKMKEKTHQQLNKQRGQLYQWYVIEKKSATKIGEMIGLTKSTVLKRLKVVGIKIRSPEEEAFIQYKKNVIKPSNNQLKMWYIDQKKSTYDIGKIVGVSKTTIIKWLKETGVSLRKGNYKKL